MRIAIVMLGLLTGVGLPALGHAGAPACDVATSDAVRAVYKRLTGEQLSTQHECIKISNKFPGLVSIGSFAYDRGCRWKQVLYDCKLDPKDASRLALTAAGWPQADTNQRAQLALAWLAEIDGLDPVDSEPKGWKEKHKTFQPPQSTATADGGLVLKFWLRQPTGMRPVSNYTLLSVTFTADGLKGETKERESFAVPIN